MSKIETNKIDSISGTSTLKIGETNATTLDFDTGITSVTNIPQGLTNKPYFVMTRSSQTGISDDAYTKAQLNTADLDSASGADTTTNYRYTVQSGDAGIFFLSWSCTGITNSNNDNKSTILQIRKNGSNIAQINLYGSDSTSDNRENGGTITTIEDLSVGDYIEGFVRINSSANANNNSASNMRLTGFRLIG